MELYNIFEKVLRKLFIESKKPHRNTLLLQMLLIKEKRHLHFIQLKNLSLQIFSGNIILIHLGKPFDNFLIFIGDDNQYFKKVLYLQTKSTILMKTTTSFTRMSWSFLCN